MSVEFSGQITRSGCGSLPRRPSRQLVGGGDVVVGDLSIVELRPSSPRARGHVALDGGDYGRLGARRGPGRGAAPRAGRTPGPRHPASASAASTARRSPARRSVAASVTAVSRSQASGRRRARPRRRAPAGRRSPPSPASGSPAWLIASLPHGKPPHGQRSLNASAATHQPATASGQPAQVEQQPLGDRRTPRR